MTAVAEESTKDTTLRAVSGGIVRYLSPELLTNDKTLPTMDSDVYSFAMLMLECITEETPFSEYSRDAAVIRARIIEEKRPLRPGGPDPRKCVSGGLWDLMLRCWSTEGDCRPTMGQVYSFLLYSR